MDLEALVLASPRGRFFCATIAYRCSSDQRVAARRRPRTADDVREVIESVDLRAIPELSELELLDALEFAADCARYWQEPDDDDLIFARPHITSALHPAAATVLSSAQTAWWADPVDLDNQRFVVHRYSNDQWPESTMPYRPDSTGLDRWREHTVKSEAGSAEYRTKHPDVSASGEWWSTPSPSGALATSRSREGLGALELILEEDSFGCGEARVWVVHTRNNPRVYEIRNPTDWAHLVDSYPLAVPESKRYDWFRTTGEHHHWVIPDWVAVAEDYDGVHLSLHGYLTTPGIAIPLSNSAGATVLAGWNPDVTWWLNSDATVTDDEPALWQRHDERWVQS